MRQQKIMYSSEYGSADAELVSQLLVQLLEVFPIEHLQMEWVADNARYEHGLLEGPEAIKSQLGSGWVRLDGSRRAIDEKWFIEFAPWSFSAELFSRSREVMIDIADSSSLTVGLRGDARLSEPRLLELLNSSGLPFAKIS